MKKSTINFRNGFLFPWPFQFIALLVVLASIPLMVAKPLLGVGLMLAGVLVLTSYSGTEINREEQTFKEYYWFLFFKSGKKFPYTKPEKIYIKGSKVQQQLHTAHTGASSIFSSAEYNAFVKFEDSKLHVLTKRNKEKLIKLMNELSAFLNVPLEDHTVQ